jgi:hypothetical protein
MSRLCESSDTRENLVGRLGPHEGPRPVIVDLEKLLNRALQFGDAPVTAAPNLLGRQFRTPSFDEVQPRVVP